MDDAAPCTRADFDAWLAAQPRPDHVVTGYAHGVFVRWCAAVLARGGRVDLDEVLFAAPTFLPDDGPELSTGPAPEEAPNLDAHFAQINVSDPDRPLVAYTDGSGTIATKPCGAGVVIYDDEVVILEASRFLGNGTNNRAELSAIGIAVATTADPSLASRELLVRSDSEYAIGALTRAHDTERERPNAKLINHIRGLLRGRAVRFEHVPGHSGVLGNERADQLAGLARRRGMTARARADMAHNGFTATCSDGGGGSR